MKLVTSATIYERAHASYGRSLEDSAVLIYESAIGAHRFGRFCMEGESALPIAPAIFGRMKAYLSKPETPTHVLQILMRYKAWAIAETTKTVISLSRKQSAVHHQRALRDIISALTQIYAFNKIYQSQLEQENGSNVFRCTEQNLQVDQVCEAVEAVSLGYIELADRLTKAQLAEFQQLRIDEQECYSVSKADILLHVVSLSSRHLAWINGLIGECSGRPPDNDLEAFLERVWQKTV